MKNIIYLRTSTKEQNPQNQLADCQKLFGEAEIIEDKQSAWKDNKEREGFEIIKKKIKKGEISNLIVWDLDRIHRNRQKLLEFFKLCQNFNCKIHSVRQEWLESLNKIQPPFNEIMHDLMLQIIGWLAEEESSKKSQRVKIAFKNHKKDDWGRPSIPSGKISETLKLREEGKTIRSISQQLSLGVGSVHKIISSFTNKNLQNLNVRERNL